MKLDARHLAQLSAIVEVGSFQAASELLGLTQSALSRNMKKLEDRLGAQLFVRDGRKSKPNVLALRLAKSGLAIRIAEEQASRHAKNIASGDTGELRLGAPPIVAGRYLSTILAKFINDNPACTAELKSGLVHELKLLLERGKIDLVIAPESLAEQEAGLTSTPLIDDRVGILCRCEHPLAKKKHLSTADLEGQYWLAHSKGSLLRQQTETAMFASGVRQIQIVCETDSIRSALEITATTDLITTMPVAATKPYLEDKLVFLPFEHPQLSRPLSAIQLAGIPLNPITAKFLQELRNSTV